MSPIGRFRSDRPPQPPIAPKGAAKTGKGKIKETEATAPKPGGLTDVPPRTPSEQDLSIHCLNFDLQFPRDSSSGRSTGRRTAETPRLEHRPPDELEEENVDETTRKKAPPPVIPGRPPAVEAEKDD